MVMIIGGSRGVGKSTVIELSEIECTNIGSLMAQFRDKYKISIDEAYEKAFKMAENQEFIDAHFVYYDPSMRLYKPEIPNTFRDKITSLLLFTAPAELVLERRMYDSKPRKKTLEAVIAEMKAEREECEKIAQEQSLVYTYIENIELYETVNQFNKIMEEYK